MLAEAGPLKLDLDLRGDEAVMNLVGDVDIATVPLVRDCVIALASGPAGAPRVTVDLTEVHFIDSTGLGAFVEGLALMRAAGGDLRLRSPQGTAKRIIELTGLDKVLIVEP